MLCGINVRFQTVSRSVRQIAHVLLTRPPLSYPGFRPKTSSKITPFDLHVLGVPPAFILSQDQTLNYSCILKRSRALKSQLLLTHHFFKVLCLTLQLLLSKQFLKGFVFRSIVQFSSCCLPLLKRRSIIVSHPTPLVNTFFKLFFKSF